MASPAADAAVKTARDLPPRLLRFFARYPPQIYGHNVPGSPAAMSVTTAGNTSSSDPNVAASEENVSNTLPPTQKIYSPFSPHKNVKTGYWQGPRFGLRRQADLCKLAERHGVEDLLPWSSKLNKEKIRKREEEGLRVRGTGVGQKVKGHKWERGLDKKLEQRRQAMLNMPAMIQEWKQRGHGRGWKKWPK